MLPGFCYPLGACICKLSITFATCYRQILSAEFATEVHSISVYFSQDHKKVLSTL